MDHGINWDNEAVFYQNVFKSCGSNEYNKRLMSFLAQNLGLRPGCRVIDVGCGVGKYGTFFASMGCDVTLSDISSEMLRHARENMAGFDTPCTYLCCDFNDVSMDEPAFEKHFDLSISTMSPAIHDVNTIKKISSVTDGYCLITHFINWEQPIRDEFYKLNSSLPRHSMDSEHLRDRNREFVQAVKEAGYEPQIKYEDYCWTDLRTPEEAAERFAGADAGAEEKEKALRSVKKLLNARGLFEDGVNTKVAWVYWDCRRPENK